MELAIRSGVPLGLNELAEFAENCVYVSRNWLVRINHRAIRFLPDYGQQCSTFMEISSGLSKPQRAFARAGKCLRMCPRS